LSRKPLFAARSRSPGPIAEKKFLVAGDGHVAVQNRLDATIDSIWLRLDRRPFARANLAPHK
jgi:hypothetical protein